MRAATERVLRRTPHEFMYVVCKRGNQSRGQGRDAARKRAVAEFRTPDAGTNAAASAEGEESGGEESVKNGHLYCEMGNYLTRWTILQKGANALRCLRLILQKGA